jgi:hypothetical protein
MQYEVDDDHILGGKTIYSQETANRNSTSAIYDGGYGTEPPVYEGEEESGN